MKRRPVDWHRFGRRLAWAGAIVTALALLGAGVALYLQLYVARLFLLLVPFGFLALFTGVVTTFIAGGPLDGPDLD